jgi:hypothetical protein
MSSKKEIIQYGASVFVLGLLIGCWVTLNFGKDLKLMPSKYVYDHDLQYQEKVEALAIEHGYSSEEDSQ